MGPVLRVSGVLAQTSRKMETDERMSKRLWLLGVVGLVLIGLLMACGSKYNSSSDGLLLVGSQGSSVIQTFSFNLNNGHASAIANSTNDTGNKTCILSGTPGFMVVDPAGAYAYVIFSKSTQCPNPTAAGIAIFQVKSDGTLSQVGDPVQDPNPVMLSMDAAGKFLFVAEGGGLVNSYAIGSGGALTLAGGNFNFVNGGGFQPPNIVAVASSPTVFPKIGINGVQNAVCSTPGNNPPSVQTLYAVDSVNYVVWEFSVDTATGAIGNPPGATAVPYIATDTIPAGVAVDPCARFVYVSNSLSNKVSAYTICNGLETHSPLCTGVDGTLFEVAGSPFASSGNASGLGQIVVDPFGNNVYVVGTLSNTVSAYEITPVSGSLQPMTPAVVATGSRPTAIAIRADDNWMFVSNFNSASVSQYSITPATGELSAAAPITTDNLPFGVAVK
jgi:6-phosphogluconolactonase (cycloisomerase 2 family)